MDIIHNPNCTDLDLMNKCLDACNVDQLDCLKFCNNDAACISACNRDHANCSESCPCMSGCYDGCEDCENEICLDHILVLSRYSSDWKDPLILNSKGESFKY